MAVMTPAVRGDYVVTPAHLRMEEPIEFFGRDPGLPGVREPAGSRARRTPVVRGLLGPRGRAPWALAPGSGPRAGSRLRRERLAGVPRGQPRSLVATMTPTSPDMLLAFAAGLLSVLSPCVLPLLPAYLSLISGHLGRGDAGGRGRAAGARARDARVPRLRRPASRCVFVLMGVGAVAAGHVLRTWRTSVFGVEFGVSQIAGAVIVVLGLHMMGDQPDPRALPRHALPLPHRAGAASSSSLRDRRGLRVRLVAVHRADPRHHPDGGRPARDRARRGRPARRLLGRPRGAVPAGRLEHGGVPGGLRAHRSITSARSRSPRGWSWWASACC